MLQIVKIDKTEEFPKLIPEKLFIDFLYNHLGKYKDTKQDITKAINYAFSEENGKGGFIIIAMQEGKTIGGAVVNKTGMSGYIPNYFLVYIVSHNGYRRRGVGKKILQRVLDECNYDVALHVEPDNPARELYKKMGFNSKYIEMRCKKKKPLFPPKINMR
jgi:GNAT superfamily N-acetyltransferase